MTGLVSRWLAAGELDLPLPGSGATAARWRRLSELAEIDVVAGRLAEAHTDAIAIIDELGGDTAEFDQLWGVWAAELPDTQLEARDSGDGLRLYGTKAWCSGAGLCAHALVTAKLDDGRRALVAVDLSSELVDPLPSTWTNPGMVGSDTRSVRFTGAPAAAVGKPDEYLGRPGFWHGAIGVAACWLGAARAVAAPLYQRAMKGAADEHALAHLGAVDAALTAAGATLLAAASEIDLDPLDHFGHAELRARRARAVVETAVDQAITRTGRALGAAPLCLDPKHAQAVADLTIYVRQSHAERDLCELGRLAGGDQ